MVPMDTCANAATSFMLTDGRLPMHPPVTLHRYNSGLKLKRSMLSSTQSHEATGLD
jgi:hypothetical protein